MKYENLNLDESINKNLKKWKRKTVKIENNDYTLYIFEEQPQGNLYEGFLFITTKDEKVIHKFKKYDPYREGLAYCARIIIVKDDKKGSLFIRDTLHNKYVIKTLKKINKTFFDKLNKALSEPKEENLSKLFDRTDVIEEFYILYKKAREYLLKNISGISEEEKREEFIDNFMMQMLTLWYLQERAFFNNDKNYFITKFKELKQRRLFNKFKSYYEFLTYLFDKISGYEDKQYYEDEVTGKVVIVGSAVFLNGEHKGAISLPDECFYKEGITDVLITTPPKNVSQEVPLLNLFESRDWTEGNIDEFVLGAIYEKLINYDEKKKTGAYYTPEEITSYICKNTIEPYLVDRVNEEFRKNFETIEQIIESSDKKMILYLFKQLKEIKILDPAVGSAHFLESAINVLVSVYEKIWEKAKELGIREGLEIIAADEKGEIRKIDLLEVEDEEQFNLLVKFFIILSKNVYGVDINPSAIKVARARLFLTLAKHFKIGKDKDVFVRFPNVHFNLRTGNSLIGYIEFKEEQEKKDEQLENNQMSIFEFLVEEEKTNYITEKIGIVTELKEYLKKIAESLNLGNIIKEIEELNKILSKSKIGWDDFEKVLRTKEKLITILIASLNSEYAKKLNDLLREITGLFNQKLDEKFAENHKIKLEELKKIKTFHWIFEFPEVFLDRGGFDIIVGNPPYGNTLESLEKNICQNYASYTGEIASVFVERSVLMNKRNGYFSFIITYAITFSKDLSGARKKIYEHYQDCFISTFDRDRCRFFDNMTQSVSIMICKKKIWSKSCKFYTSQMFRTMPQIEKINYQLANNYLLGNKIGVSFNKKRRLPKIGHPTILKILEKIATCNTTIGDLISSHGEKIWIRTSGNYWYNAWDREPYQNTKIQFINVKSDYESFLLILINSSTYYLWFRIYGDGRDMNTDIMKALPIPEKEKIKALNPLLSHISSLLMNFLFLNFDKEHNRFNTSNVKPVIDICDIIIGKLYGFSKEEIEFILNFENVIRGGKRTSDWFFILVDYLLAYQTLKVNFLNYDLINSLVYELYFKEKFAEDGLYSEPKEYLLEAVSKHLKPINYDCYAELYWKRQLEGNLLDQEEKEIEILEKENLKIIEEIYNTLKHDKEVGEWMKKIKSHEWVKVLEGEN